MTEYIINQNLIIHDPSINSIIYNYTDVSNILLYDINNNVINNNVITTITTPYKHSIYITYDNFEISEEQQNCCVCMETREKEDICSLDCEHSFCQMCIKTILKKHQPLHCPLCRNLVTLIFTQKIEIEAELNEYCI